VTRSGFALQDKSFQHQRRQPCQPDDAADVAVGNTFLGGRIGERGDFAAFDQLPPTPCESDGAQDVWILLSLHFNLDIFGRQEARAAAALADLFPSFGW
jgi:hypothetical protein